MAAGTKKTKRTATIKNTRGTFSPTSVKKKVGRI